MKQNDKFAYSREIRARNPARNIRVLRQVREINRSVNKNVTQFFKKHIFVICETFKRSYRSLRTFRFRSEGFNEEVTWK